MSAIRGFGLPMPGVRDDGILDRFHPAFAGWFREHLGSPTPAQREGLPAIASGQHTPIAPTGSGKTLAAFLAALDHIWRTTLQAETPKPNGKPDPKSKLKSISSSRSEAKHVRIPHVSPLKALNQDG